MENTNNNALNAYYFLHHSTDTAVRCSAMNMNSVDIDRLVTV